MATGDRCSGPGLDPMRRRLICALPAVLALAPYGRLSRAQGAAAAAGIALPIEIHDSLVFVPVRVNGSDPQPFILDTGASETLLNATLVRSLGIGVGRERDTIAGAGEGSAELARTRQVQLSYGPLALARQDLGAVSLSAIEAVVGRPISGILGAEVFRRWIVTIDYVAPRLVLRDPALGAYSGPGDVLPLRLSGGRPFVRSAMTPLAGPPIEGLWVIDTGDASTFALHTPFVDKNRLRASDPAMTPHVTHGIAGPSVTWRGRIAGLQLGRFRLERPVATFAAATKGSEADRSYDGAVGGGILRRFTVTFDYSRRQMILAPSTAFAMPFDFDLSGLSLAVAPPDFSTVRVTAVQAQSPAAAAGFQDGDVLESVDGRSVAAISLDALREALKAEGRGYTVVVRRSDGATRSLDLRIHRRG